MHCNEVLHACRVDPIYCDIFWPAERVPIYGLPINLRNIYKRVPALFSTPRPPTQALIHSPQPSTSFTPTVPVQPPRQSSRQRGLLPNLTTTILAVRRTSATEGVGESKQPTFSPKHQTGLILPLQPSEPFNLLLLQTTLISSPPPTLLPNSNQIRHQLFLTQAWYLSSLLPGSEPLILS